MSDAKNIEAGLWRKYANILPPERNGNYKSCTWLEGGLAFLYGDVKLCCCRGPVTEKHTNSSPSISEILNKRKFIIEGLRNNTLEDACSCKNCIYLVEKKWAIKPYIFDYITVANYGKCNIRCKFCNLVRNPYIYKKSAESENIPMLPFFKKIIKDRLLSPNATVNISGGEPALFNEFHDLVRFLAPNVGELIIFSNGTCFSESIYESFKYGSISLIISLDSADPKIYQAIKGKDLCDIAWANAARYASVGGDRVIGKMIFMDENFQDIKNFVDRAKKCGLKMLYYDFLRCGNSVPKFPRAAQAIANFKFHCLKNDIICCNAQTGFMKDIEDESEEIFKRMVDKEGIVVKGCLLLSEDQNPDINSLVTLTATTIGYVDSRTHFKFLSKYENEEWLSLGNYSPENQYVWRPLKNGIYSLCVYVKDIGSSRPFNDYSIIEVKVGG